MPACEFGAHPTPAAEGLQVWIDRLQLPLDIVSMIQRLSPLGWVAITASLVDMEGICAENPSLPEPFTLLDFIEQTASSVVATPLAQPRVIEKAYRWLRYGQFLLFCVCNDPPLTPGFNCTAAPASIALGPLGSVTAAYPVTIDQALIDTWTVFGNGDWQWHARASATVIGGANNGDNLIVEYLNVNGVWQNTTADLQFFIQQGDCVQFEFQASVPKMGTSTAIRIRNNAGGAHTINNFQLCFCPAQTFPPQLPTQPPLDNVPSPPATVCSNDDICALLNALAHRVTLLAAQLSDVQASVSGRDVLRVLSSVPISGEGELSLPLGTRAVSIQLLELGPDVYTSALGRPRGLMRAGSIRWADGIGYSFRRFVDAERFDDPSPPGALALSWQLLPGTSGNLAFLG